MRERRRRNKKGRVRMKWIRVVIGEEGKRGLESYVRKLNRKKREEANGEKVRAFE